MTAASRCMQALPEHLTLPLANDEEERRRKVLPRGAGLAPPSDQRKAAVERLQRQMARSEGGTRRLEGG